MVYITGDTHGDIREFSERMRPYRLTKDDVLIITGDFGFDWDNHVIMQWMKSGHPYTVLFCDGNHENYDVLDALKQEEHFGGPVGRFDSNTFRLMTGNMYDIQGIKTFVFGGAASIDKDWRLEPENIQWMGKLWWEKEIPASGILELAKHTLERSGWHFDLFLTHTCPPAIKGEVLNGKALDFHDPVEDMIRDLEDEIRKNGGGYGSHFFGHFHVDRDLPRRHCMYKRVMKYEQK